MNKRIKELVEKSKEYATESTKNFTGDEPIGFMDFYTEKFAQLIVQECSNFLKDTLDDHFASEQLEEHFGVEE